MEDLFDVISCYFPVDFSPVSGAAVLGSVHVGRGGGEGSKLSGIPMPLITYCAREVRPVYI